MRANNAGGRRVLFVHRTAGFDRNLEDLRQKGGKGSMAAEKAEVVIRQITDTREENFRKQFRLTRRGEYRIKHCGKYDLGCGHRLVFIRRKGHITFLYVGSHDDCFRWIQRNRGFTYEIGEATNAIQIMQDQLVENTPDLHEATEEDSDADEYETQLTRRIDDKILRKIFSGFAEL